MGIVLMDKTMRAIIIKRVSFLRMYLYKRYDSPIPKAKDAPLANVIIGSIAREGIKIAAVNVIQREWDKLAVSINNPIQTTQNPPKKLGFIVSKARDDFIW